MLQNSINSKSANVKDDESDRCSKLTKVVSNKSKEITDLKAENKSLKERNQSILMKMNEASSSATALETKNTRLESQVENLISAFGSTKSAHIEAAPKAPSNNVEEVENKSPTKLVTKCKHNDKAICTRKDTCQFVHNKTVCSPYSKHGVCENEISCMKRHPYGTCHRWKRGTCDKSLECFYRHPAEEEGSESRKRTLSDHSVQSNKSQKIAEGNLKTQEEHFLFQKMMEKFLEEKRLEKKEENIPKGWMNAAPAPSFHHQPATPLPAFTPQQTNQTMSYQHPFAQATPSGSHWIQHQPPQQMMYQVPGIHQYQI